MTKSFKPILFILLSILVLITIDQGVKIAVEQAVTADDGLMQVSDAVHIHPYFNGADRAELQPIAEKYNLPIDFLMILEALSLTMKFVLFGLCAYFVDRFFFWDTPRKHYPLLTASMICLIVAGLLCHAYIDELFRGGTLDYICISRTIEITEQVGDHIHTVTAPHHRFFDLADIYIASSLLLTIVRIGLWCVSLLKQNAADPKSISAKLKHPIRNIRSMTERRTV